MDPRSDPTPAASAERERRRSAICLGVAVIALTSIMETVVADHHMPSPVSPYLWTVLGAVGTLSLVASLWFRARARAATRAEPSRH